MASPYLVSVAQLLRDVPSVRVLAFEALFDEHHEFAPRGRAETDVKFDSLVTVDLRLESFIGGLRAKGHVRSAWHGICRRCSIAVTGEISVGVSERFVDTRGPGDDDAYLVKNDAIDLAPLVHDAILLELPIAPLCNEDCRGLCPICGIDRNEASCGCRAPVDARWATLDELRFTDVPSDESNEV